jgi:branched-chain amino acid transport system ATP-binding protein
MNILTIRDLHKNFGGLEALDGVSFDIEERTVTALIGPNGSGKTTLFNVVTGIYTPDKGDINFCGDRLNGLKPHQILLKGLGRTFQITRTFPRMTVLENMLVAPKGQVGENIVAVFLKRDEVAEQEDILVKEALDLLKFLEIDHVCNEYAASLSGGQLKLLELGRILMAHPKMILLDEPVAGVNPTLAQKIFDRILELGKRGLTFLIVEHNMDVIMSFCDKIHVMNKGQIVAEGSPEEIQNNEEVVDIYLGV